MPPRRQWELCISVKWNTFLNWSWSFLIHSRSDLRSLQLQSRWRWIKRYPRLESVAPIRSLSFSPPLSKIEIASPRRARTSFSISLGSESRQKKKESSSPLKIAMDEPPCFSRGPAQHQSRSPEVEKKKRTFLNLRNFAAAHAVTFSSVPCHNELGCSWVNIFPALWTPGFLPLVLGF